jgi:endonuclease YncB( thermonuclease family)
MTRRFFLLSFLAFSLAANPLHSWAAKRLIWFTLNDCRYVAHPSNDGDSFRVKCGEDEFQLRLYFVDAPEGNLTYSERSREQSEYFGVSIDETLKVGARAKQYVEKLLRKTFVVHTKKATAPGRGASARYYGLVDVGGDSLVELLVSDGFARNRGTALNLRDGTKSRAYVQKLQALEDGARTQRKGIWASAKIRTVPRD